MRMVKLGVLPDRQKAELYDTRQLAEPRERFDILLAGLVRDDEEPAGRLLAYAREGGARTTLGGLHSAAQQLGCKRKADEEAGYGKQDRLHEANAIRYLQASPWEIVEPNDRVSNG